MKGNTHHNQGIRRDFSTVGRLMENNRLHDPRFNSVVSGVLLLDGPLTLSDLRQLIQKHLLAHERFRSRIVVDDQGNHVEWEELEMSDIDIDWHVTEVALPRKADTAELNGFISRLYATTFPPTRPMWRVFLLSNHVTPAGVSSPAVLVRVSHAIGDGTSMVRVLYSLLDSKPPTSNNGNVSDAVRTTDQSNVAVTPGPHPSPPLWRQLSSPFAASRRVVLFGRGVVQGLFQIFYTPDPDSVLKPPPDQWQRTPCLAMSGLEHSLCLERVKAVKNRMGCTVNDVLCACLSLAIGAFLRETKDKALQVAGESLVLRGLAPINTRGRGADREYFGNKFVLAAVNFPVGTAAYSTDVVAALRAAKLEMDSVKVSPATPITFFIFTHVFPLLSNDLTWKMTRKASELASFVFTNVVGPNVSSICGVPLSQIMFYVNALPSCAVFSVISFQDRISLGVQTSIGDPSVPHRLTELFHREFERMHTEIVEKHRGSPKDLQCPLQIPIPALLVALIVLVCSSSECGSQGGWTESFLPRTGWLSNFCLILGQIIVVVWVCVGLAEACRVIGRV